MRTWSSHLRQLSVFWCTVMRNLNQQMDIDASVVLASEEIISFVHERCCRVRRAEKGTGGRTHGQRAAFAIGTCSNIGAVRRP
jgi:hypothetical protein